MGLSFKLSKVGKRFRPKSVSSVAAEEEAHKDVVNVTSQRKSALSPARKLTEKANENKGITEISASIPRVPKVRDVTILGDYKTNEKVIVQGDVVNGTEQASTVQWFITVSKNFDIETGLQAISECTINKDFQIPIEAVCHYLVAKFTPMTEDGESGESRYAITDRYVEDSAPQKARKVREKNKNKKIAALKSGEKMEIEFYNNRAVGKKSQMLVETLGKNRARQAYLPYTSENKEGVD